MRYTQKDILIRDYKEKMSGKLMIVFVIFFLIPALVFYLTSRNVLGDFIYVAYGLCGVVVVLLPFSIKGFVNDAAAKELELKTLESGMETEGNIIDIKEIRKSSKGGYYYNYRVTYSFKDSYGSEQVRLCMRELSKIEMESLENEQPLKIIYNIDDDIFLLLKRKLERTFEEKF